jgi:hypothetical protein
MTGFILKDLLTLRRYLKTLMLFVVFFAAMSYSLEGTGFIMAMVAVPFAMLPVTSFAYDQQAKWDWFAQTLPASRREIVAGKYVLSIACTAAGTILGLALAAVTGLLKGEPADPRELAFAGGVIFAAGMIFLSVLIPLIYKFGVERGRILLLLVMAAAALVGAVSGLPGAHGLADASPGAVLAAALAGAAVATAVSFFISMAIYESRDF